MLNWRDLPDHEFLPYDDGGDLVEAMRKHPVYVATHVERRFLSPEDRLELAAVHTGEKRATHVARLRASYRREIERRDRQQRWNELDDEWHFRPVPNHVEPIPEPEPQHERKMRLFVLAPEYNRVAVGLKDGSQVTLEPGQMVCTDDPDDQAALLANPGVVEPPEHWMVAL